MCVIFSRQDGKPGIAANKVKHTYGEGISAYIRDGMCQPIKTGRTVEDYRNMLVAVTQKWQGRPFTEITRNCLLSDIRHIVNSATLDDIPLQDLPFPIVLSAGDDDYFIDQDAQLHKYSKT